MTVDLHNYIDLIKDFPEPGILFRDVSPLIGDGEAYGQAIRTITDFAAQYKPDVIAGPEARGFIVGSPLAFNMGIGFVPARKTGKLPNAGASASYDLEYGTNELQMSKNSVKPGQRVFIVDDLLATGGTIAATMEMVRQQGGIVVGTAFLIELEDLHGREKIMANEEVPFLALLEY